MTPFFSLSLILITAVIGGVAVYRASAEGRSAPTRIARTPRFETLPAPPESPPAFVQSWVSPAGHRPSAHSCATSVLPSGELLAVWFAGSREGARDVGLFTARYDPQTSAWTSPVMVVDRSTAQNELERPIRKVGNVTIFPDRNGTLWLVYVTVTAGGWSGSALNVKSSRDDGRTWTASQRLNVNPFLNLSSLVRNKPVYAEDGRIGLPIYHEMASTYPQMLWLTPGADGRLRDYVVRRMPHGNGLIQPSVVPLENQRAVVLFRDHTSMRRLRTAYSEDNGWTWSKPAAGALPNPDAAVDAVRLRNGKMLLVYNHTDQGRANLRLAVSADDGRTWQSGPTIEDETLQEFSYPCLIEDQRGYVHLTYTWKRQRIKHAAFNLGWLEQSLPPSTLKP